MAAPQVDDLLDLRVGLPSLQVLDCAGVVLPLDVQRAGLTASGQPHRPATGDIMANLTDGADRVIQGKITEGDSTFDHFQHERRGAHLEHGGGLGHVGVADDDVQPPVLLGVGMWLVAGVDNGAGSGRGARDALPNVFGALA